MTGLEEARAFYEQYGREMIHEKFPEYEDSIAVGLVGHGSECYGFDDEISRDHDFNNGFCLWITDKDDIFAGVELHKAYNELPVKNTGKSSALGGDSRGVSRINFFYKNYTGLRGLPQNWQQWLSIPETALAEAVNGEVWRDDLGVFSLMREVFQNGMPEDVWKKRLAARAAEMAQSGQYNYARCLSRGQEGAAMMALGQFVKSACEMIYLLNRKHMPYYKWMFRGMDGLTKLKDMKEPLEFLLTGDNDEAGKLTKAGVIEDICAAIIKELQSQKLSDGSWDYMEPHAFEIMERIQDSEIRNLHLMEG